MHNTVTAIGPKGREPRARRGDPPALMRKRALLAMAIAVLLIMAGRVMSPGWNESAQRAFAAPATISGKADIVITNKQQSYYEGVVAQCRATIHLPDGTTQVADGHCISGGYYSVPLDGTYDYEGTLQPDGTYSIIIHSEVSMGANSETFNPGEELGTQQMGDIHIRYNPKTKTTFKKSSSDQGLSGQSSAYSLEGAEYDIFDARTQTKVASITTDRNGTASCPLEQECDFYAIETKAPKGFLLSKERVTFRTKGNEMTVSLHDRPGSTQVRIRKKDSCTGGAAQAGATLSGAEFTITSLTSPGWTRTVTTDADGTAALTSIPLGTISIKETKAPAGYLPDTKTRTYTVDGSHIGQGGVVELAPIEIAEDISSFDIELVKYLDSGNEGSGLQPAGKGIQFEIISNSTGGKIGTLTTNEHGRASTADPKTVNREAVAPSATHDASRPWMGSGKRNERIAGAIPFDAKGYTVREVASTTPEGYRPCEDWTIDAEQMTNGATCHYIVDNDFVSSRIQIVKVDGADGLTVPLAGFSFQLLDHAKNPISQDVWYPQHAKLDTFTTDGTGTVTLPEALIPGTYYIREVAAPSPYIPSTQDIEVVIRDQEVPDPITVIHVEDRQATGTVRVTKRCSDEQCPHGGSLRGAEFDVIAAEDIVSPTGTVQAGKDEVVAHIVTDEDGVAHARGLSLGDGTANYSLVETKAPDGHVLDPTPRPFTITHDEPGAEVAHADVVVSNNPTRTVIGKTDAQTGERLQGATLALWNIDDQISVDSSQQGAVALRAAEKPDTVSLRFCAPYAVVEVDAPDGAEVALSDGSGEPIIVGREATKVPAGSYDVICTIDGKRLSLNSAHITIKANESYSITITQGPIGAHFKSTATGPAEEEIKLPYSKDDEAFTAQGLRPGAHEVLVDGNVIGTITQGEGAGFYSIDEKGVHPEPILLAGDKHPVVLTTPKDGRLSIDHLQAGEYRLREVDAPRGYVTSASVLPLTVDPIDEPDDESDIDLAVENDFTKIEISKLDTDSEQAIAGATLSLVAADGSVIDRWVSQEQPHVLTRIEPGTYLLVEERPPQGHDAAGSLEVEVLPIAEPQRFALRDKAIRIEGRVDKRQERIPSTSPDEMADRSAKPATANAAGADHGSPYIYTVDFQNSSSTWVDEFTVTDVLTCAQQQRAELVGVTTPQSEGDRDGKVNVWYQTNLSSREPAASDKGDAPSPNATLHDGHENPWLNDESVIQTLGEDRRIVSYDGWRLWAKDMPAGSATHLNVSDLHLVDGERITGVRFEYGCVDAGFGTQSASWDRPNLKDEGDECILNHDGTPHSKGAIFHMCATSPSKQAVLLENTVMVDLARNGGGRGLVAHDTDRVAQQIPPKPEDRPTILPQTSSMPLAPTLLVFSSIIGGIVVLMRRASTRRRGR